MALAPLRMTAAFLLTLEAGPVATPVPHNPLPHGRSSELVAERRELGLPKTTLCGASNTSSRVCLQVFPAINCDGAGYA